MRFLALLVLPACLAGEELHIRIVEAAGPVHVAGSRSGRPLVVEVVDQSGRPVEGAAVSFRLPGGTGPGGMFENGLPTEVVITKSDGLAAAPGIRWNKVAGPFQIQVLAAKGDLRGSASSPRRLVSSADDASGPAVGTKSNRRLILIIAAAAGSATVAGLGYARRSASSSPSNQSSAPSIGAPVITIGGP